jgi:hypothetical protein
MEENVWIVVDSRLVQFVEDSHENVRARFGGSMNVVVVRRCDAPYGLGLVGVHEGRFLATVGRSWEGTGPGSASPASRSL